MCAHVGAVRRDELLQALRVAAGRRGVAASEQRRTLARGLEQQRQLRALHLRVLRVKLPPHVAADLPQLAATLVPEAGQRAAVQRLLQRPLERLWVDLLGAGGVGGLYRMQSGACQPVAAEEEVSTRRLEALSTVAFHHALPRSQPHAIALHSLLVLLVLVLLVLPAAWCTWGASRAWHQKKV